MVRSDRIGDTGGDGRLGRGAGLGPRSWEPGAGRFVGAVVGGWKPKLFPGVKRVASRNGRARYLRVEGRLNCIDPGEWKGHASCCGVNLALQQAGARELGAGGSGAGSWGAGSLEPGAGSLEPGAGSREPGAWSLELGAGSVEFGAGSVGRKCGVGIPGATRGCQASLRASFGRRAWWRPSAPIGRNSRR